MTYMTFKIKKDWLFWALFVSSALVNIFAIYLLVICIANSQSGMLVLSILMTLALTAINGYVIFSLIKNFQVGLTKDSVYVADVTKVVIPYTSIRSIKKERTPSKYKLYDALLVIKYNKYDTIKVNCEDLESTFDNLKELVQKANLDKVVNNVVTKRDGSKEIQQAINGQTVVIPAQTTTTGTTVVKNSTIRPTVQTTVQIQPQPQTTVMPQQTVQARPTVQTTVQIQPQTTIQQQPNTQIASKKVITTTTTKAVPVSEIKKTEPTVVTSTVTNPDGTTKIITETTTTKISE